jgi:hypothetical protein
MTGFSEQELSWLREAPVDVDPLAVRLPEPRDLAIAVLLRRARRDDLLPQLVDAVRPDRDDVALRGFAYRAASMSVRDKDPDLLRLGLVAMGVASQRSRDVRDDMCVLAPLWDAAGLLGLDAAEEFAAAGRAQPAAATLFRDWVNRSPSDRGLGAFFLRHSSDADGFRYAQFSPDMPRPSHSPVSRFRVMFRGRSRHPPEGR